MKTLKGTTLSLENLNSHHHVCDLINVEYPVLSLYTDGRKNWIYLWCDRTAIGLNRWLLFTVSRDNLAKYLKGGSTMLALATASDTHWVLDDSGNDFILERGTSDSRRARRYLRVIDLDQLTEYLPSADSYFDESLTNDLDLSKQIVPQDYELPIEGQWFSVDFQYLFRRYERLYAFFYATKPRFVKSIEGTLTRCLRAPWTGGYSRVNLYQRLYEQIPGIHSLRIHSLKFASPGVIRFEAIPDVGESIQEASRLIIKHGASIDAAFKRVQKIISAGHLNKADLSEVLDSAVLLEQKSLKAIVGDCDLIANTLGIKEQMKMVRDLSPNTVVYGKAVLSFVRQLDKFADLLRRDMIKA